MVSKNLEGLMVKKLRLFAGISQEVRFVCRDCVRIILSRLFRIVCAPCLGLLEQIKISILRKLRSDFKLVDDNIKYDVN